jgi:hypothetical protein
VTLPKLGALTTTGDLLSWHSGGHQRLGIGTDRFHLIASSQATGLLQYHAGYNNRGVGWGMLDVGNTTTETSIINSVTGTQNIPAGWSGFGMGVEVDVLALLSTPASSVPNLTIRLKMGAAVWSLTLTGLTASLPSSSSLLEIKGRIVVAGTGTSATVVGTLIVDHRQENASPYPTAARPYITHIDDGIRTYNATIANTVDVTVQWSAAVSGATVHSRRSVVSLIR